MKIIKNTLLLCILPGLFLLSVLPQAAEPAEQEPIVLGMSAAFSGPSRALGIELYRGTMTYINLINEQGGIRGRKIKVITYDDGYNPDPTVENTLQLIEKDNVFALFDYVGTPTTTRMLPLLKRYSHKHISLLFPFTGAQILREPPYSKYVFNLRASYFQETEGLVDRFVQIGRKRIGVFYQIDAYGRSGWVGVRKALAKYGLDIVGEATYRRGTEFSASMEKQVSILRQANPDAIISVGSYSACAAFIRDARKANWNIPIANLSFVNMDRLVKQLVKASRESGFDYTYNLVNTQVVPSYGDITLPAVKEYRRLMVTHPVVLPDHFDTSGYKSPEFGFLSFEGFLNAKLLVTILKSLPNFEDRAMLASAIENIDELDLGIDAPISFGPDKHQGLDIVYFTTIRNGRIIPLEDWSRWAK